MTGFAGRSRLALLIRIAGLLAFLVAASLLAHGLAEAIDFRIRPSNEDLVHRTIMIAVVLYAVLLAIPFVPGAEVGWTLITVLGPRIAVLVYLCTIAGLSLSFFAGRLIPVAALVDIAEAAGLRRLSGVLKTIEPMDSRQRLSYLASTAPSRILPALLRHRYLTLAVALNIPGNVLIGGGGGIAIVAGASRLYTLPGFLVTIALAVAPVPAAVLIFGTEVLGR